MSKMKQTFDSYLNSNYSNKGQEHTHTRIGDSALNIKGGVYTVSDLTEFYSKYIKHVFDNGKFEFLTEKQQLEAGPIAVDFDFRYDVSIEEKQHTSDQLFSNGKSDQIVFNLTNILLRSNICNMRSI